METRKVKENMPGQTDAGLPPTHAPDRPSPSGETEGERAHDNESSDAERPARRERAPREDEERAVREHDDAAVEIAPDARGEPDTRRDD
jgi:hypothetical protein